MPDPQRAGAYTASDKALHGRGSGHARLGLYRKPIKTEGLNNRLYKL